LSAKWISEGKLPGIGAIASKRAAEMYNLQVLAEEVEADRQNFTRFLLVSGNEYVLSIEKIAGSGVDKSMLCFSLPHKVGSLFQVLSILAYYNINLTKIQSLPVVGRAWEYLFHIDLQFSDFRQYRLALDAIRPLTEHLEILGEYSQGIMPDVD
jgi:prephenate dehydratase